MVDSLLARGRDVVNKDDCILGPRPSLTSSALYLKSSL